MTFKRALWTFTHILFTFTHHCHRLLKSQFPVHRLGEVWICVWQTQGSREWEGTAQTLESRFQTRFGLNITSVMMSSLMSSSEFQYYFTSSLVSCHVFSNSLYTCSNLCTFFIFPTRCLLEPGHTQLCPAQHLTFSKHMNKFFLKTE